jgi:predicted acetyltransferase
MEIRKLTEDDRETRTKLMIYAFQTSRNTYDKLELDKDPLDWYYGAFDEDTMVATVGAVPFDMRMRSRDFKMDGVMGVATKPEYRNRGIVREIMVIMFKNMYDNKIPISVLYPFKFSFYEMLGYKLVDEHVFYQFRISDIIYRKTDYHMKEVVRINDDIRKVYDKVVSKFDYIAKRPIIDYWRVHFKENYKFICYNGDQPVGYVIMRFSKPLEPRLKSPEKTIQIREVFWLDQAARQTIFNFLWSHRDQRKYIAGAFPADENIIDLLKTPRIVRRTIIGNSLLRIIDAKAILENLEYPLSNFTLTFHIHDKYCPWNNGYFTIDSKDRKITVEFNESSEKVIDIQIDISFFAQLVAGFRTISDLLEFGFIKVNNENLEVLQKLFPKTNNYLHDFF